MENIYSNDSNSNSDSWLRSRPRNTSLCSFVTQVFPGLVKTNHLERTTFYGPDSSEERRQFRQLVRALPLSQTPQEVADAVYGISTTKQNDVIVGVPFAAAAAANQFTGFNPFAMPFP